MLLVVLGILLSCAGLEGQVRVAITVGSQDVHQMNAIGVGEFNIFIFLRVGKNKFKFY